MTGEGQLLEPSDGAQEDEGLVDRCRRGDQNAWMRLIDKYKNLVYSIPVKYGFRHEDCNEIFQAVCLTLLAELPRIREPRALAGWLIKTTSRRCVRFRKDRGRFQQLDPSEIELPADDSKLPELLVRQLEQEQIVRRSLEALGPVCRELIELLFYRDPPISYESAASLLGLAKGSIGATRMRCLDSLKHHVQSLGLRRMP